MLLESEQQGARHKRRNRCHGTDNRAPSCGWHAHPRPLREAAPSLLFFSQVSPKNKEKEKELAILRQLAFKPIKQPAARL